MLWQTYISKAKNMSFKSWSGGGGAESSQNLRHSKSCEPHPTLDHSILIRRLETYFGFTGSVLEWFSSYLRGRSQSVMIGSTTSTSKSLEFGVPQGSILGPLLFILYIAPLQDVIATYNLSYMFYADDNQLYIAVNPKETPQVSLDKLRECTQAILHWNTQNMLSTNPGKTEVIHFTSRFQKQPIALDTFKFANTDVTVSDKVRNLGVIMDNNLSFTNHINDMCKKATLAIRPNTQISSQWWY